MLASSKKCNNLVVIVDKNNYQAMGKCSEITNCDNLAEKWDPKSPVNNITLLFFLAAQNNSSIKAFLIVLIPPLLEYKTHFEGHDNAIIIRFP